MPPPPPPPSVPHAQLPPQTPPPIPSAPSHLPEAPSQANMELQLRLAIPPLIPHNLPLTPGGSEPGQMYVPVSGGRGNVMGSARTASRIQDLRVKTTSRQAEGKVLEASRFNSISASTPRDATTGEVIATSGLVPFSENAVHA